MSFFAKDDLVKENVPLSLEEIVKITNKVGLEYASSKRDFDELEMMKSSFKARIMERYDDGTKSEAKIKRLAETDDEFVTYLRKITDAKFTCEKLRIRYESYKNLFEARRSMMSYQKAEMRLV